MLYVIIINENDLGRYYSGKIHYYSRDSVYVPGNVDSLDLAKKYKTRRGAEKALENINTKSSYVRNAFIEEIL